MARPILRLFDSGGTEVVSPISFGSAVPGVPTTEQTFTVRNNDGGSGPVDDAPGVYITGTARIAGSGAAFVSKGNAFVDARALQGRVISASGGAVAQPTGFRPLPLLLGNIPDGGRIEVGFRVVATAQSATSDWEAALAIEDRPFVHLADRPFESSGNWVYGGSGGGHTRDPDFTAVETVHGAFAAQTPPSATIELPSLVRYHLEGAKLSWRPRPAELTFDALDGDSVALAAGEYYWAGLTLGASGVLVVTKGSKASTPTSDAAKPLLAGDEVAMTWVVAPFGLAIDTLETVYAFGFFHLELLGGLDVRIHPGSGASAGFFVRPATPTEVTLPDNAQTTAWALPGNTYELATTGTFPVAERRSLKLWDFTTAGGSVVDVRDRRIMGPMITQSTRHRILFGDDYRVTGNHREISVNAFTPSLGTAAYVQVQPVPGTMDLAYDPRTPRYQVPDVGSQFDLQVASTSTADDGSPLGTGAGKIRSWHINASGVLVETDVVLNGQTPVSIDSTALALIDGRVIEVGSGGAQAGTIHFGTGVFAAGVPAQQYTTLPPLGEIGSFVAPGRAQHGVYFVPLYHSVAIAGLEVTATDAVAVQIAVMRPEVGGTGNDGPIELLGPWRTGQQLHERFDSPLTEPLPPQTWIWVEAITEGATAGPIKVRVALVLQEETT